MMPTIASAKTATYLDDSASFVIAKSVKLGLGEDEARFAPATGEQRKVEADKHAVTKCAKDEDCASDQYCTMGMCKDLCARNTTKKKVKCSGETPVCTADNHDSYCACNDESCGAALSCKKVGSRYSCEPCGAGEKCGCPDGKMSNGSGKCVTCNFDTDCADNEVCSNPKTEASSCSIVTCSTGEYVGNHQCNSCSSAIPGCTDCTSSSNCTSCEAKYQDPSGNGGECVMTTCSSGQYLNEDDGNCYPCSNGCRQCTSSTNCQVCEDAYELVSGAYCELKGCAADQYLNMADGQCYSCPAACSSCSTVMSSEETSACTACVDGYKLSGTQCVQKSCSDMGYSTSCGEGQDSVPANKSGSDGACYTCSAISGYCTSDSDCASNQKCVNNSCVKKSCGEMGYKSSCNTADGYTAVSANVTGSDGTCYNCNVASCPSGYSTSTTSCSKGYALKTNGKSGGKACGKCEEAGCSAYGYYSSCPTGKVLAGSNIGNCYARCDDVKCPSGYQKTQPSCSGAGYELLTETVSGVTCYKCGDKPCPNGYATFIQGHRDRKSVV